MTLDELVALVGQDWDFEFISQRGKDHRVLGDWLYKEILTRAGLSVSEYYLDGDNEFEFYRFHFHDYSAEILGNDLLILRGVKNILVITMKYSHS